MTDFLLAAKFITYGSTLGIKLPWNYTLFFNRRWALRNVHETFISLLPSVIFMKHSHISYLLSSSGNLHISPSFCHLQEIFTPILHFAVLMKYISPTFCHLHETLLFRLYSVIFIKHSHLSYLLSSSWNTRISPTFCHLRETFTFLLPSLIFMKHSRLSYLLSSPCNTHISPTFCHPHETFTSRQSFSVWFCTISCVRFLIFRIGLKLIAFFSCGNLLFSYINHRAYLPYIFIPLQFTPLSYMENFKRPIYTLCVRVIQAGNSHPWRISAYGTYIHKTFISCITKILPIPHD